MLVFSSLQTHSQANSITPIKKKEWIHLYVKLGTSGDENHEKVNSSVFEFLIVVFMTFMALVSSKFSARTKGDQNKKSHAHIVLLFEKIA